MSPPFRTRFLRVARILFPFAGTFMGHGFLSSKMRCKIRRRHRKRGIIHAFDLRRRIPRFPDFFTRRKRFFPRLSACPAKSARDAGVCRIRGIARATRTEVRESAGSREGGVHRRPAASAGPAAVRPTEPAKRTWTCRRSCGRARPPRRGTGTTPGSAARTWASCPSPCGRRTGRTPW